MKRKLTKLTLLLFVIGILLSSCFGEKISEICYNEYVLSKVYIYKISDIGYIRIENWENYDTSEIMEDDIIYVISSSKKEIGESCSFSVEVFGNDSSSSTYVPGRGTVEKLSTVFRPQKAEKSKTVKITYYTFNKNLAISLPFDYSRDYYDPAFTTLKKAKNAITKNTFETATGSNITIIYE